MQFKEYFKLLKARWRSLVIVTVLGGVLALAFSLFSTPLYSSKSGVIASSAQGQNATEALAGGMLTEKRVNAYQVVASSNLVLERALGKLNLPMTVQALKSKVKVSRPDQGFVIEISVIDTSASRSADIANAIADSLVAAVSDLEHTVAIGLPTTTISVIDRATTPSAPISPNIPANVLRGLSIGLGLGFGLAVLRERLDSRITSRAELEKSTESAVVGELPFDKNLKAFPVINYNTTDSASAESYRTLRTNLRFLDVDRPPRVIAITSSKPEDGKSTIAINLSLALAESGKSVILLEGDLRRPRVAKYLNSVGGIGLTTVLAGIVEVEEVIQETQFPLLRYVGAGAVPPNPSELLGSDHFRIILEKLQSLADYVIIDCPPVLLVSDPAIIGTVADGVLFVASHGRTHREEATRAVESMRAVGATVLGSVLTMVPVDELDYYEHYYYYGSGYSPKSAKGSSGARRAGGHSPEPSRVTVAQGD